MSETLSLTDASGLPCRICGSSTTPHLSDVRGHDLLRCISCDFVQVSHEPSQDELEAIYGESYYGHNKYRDQATLQAENRRRLQMVQAYTQNGARVLEVGCGDGSFIHLAKAQYQMYGFDISPAGIEIAKENNADIAERIWVGRLEDRAVSDTQFDTICLWDVIEHIWDVCEASKQILHHLKPGGFLILSTPNIGAPIAKLMGKRWAFMTPPEHLSFFNRESISHLFVREREAEIVAWQSLGKRANVGFILYKLGRVFPRFPKFIPRLFETSLLAKLAVYVPTGDVQYVVLRKR